jgi:hypothetical protein
MYPQKKEREIRKKVLQQQIEIITEQVANDVEQDNLGITEAFYCLDKIKLELEILKKLDELAEMI